MTCEEGPVLTWGTASGVAVRFALRADLGLGPGPPETACQATRGRRAMPNRWCGRRHAAH